MLTKWEVFVPIVQMSKDVKPIKYKWVFIGKHNEENKIIRCKAWLVAQCL